MVAYVLKSFSILCAGVYKGLYIQLVQDFVHQLDRVKQLVGDAVFHNLAMRVKLDKKPEADTPVDRAAITDPPGGVHPLGAFFLHRESEEHKWCNSRLALISH